MLLGYEVLGFRVVQQELILSFVKEKKFSSLIYTSNEIVRQDRPLNTCLQNIPNINIHCCKIIFPIFAVGNPKNSWVLVTFSLQKKFPKQKAPSDSSTKTLTHNLGYMGYTSYIMIDLMSSINSQVQKKIEIKAKMF
jgi:hypothetical protein